MFVLYVVLDFDVSVGGCELRISLLCHFDPLSGVISVNLVKFLLDLSMLNTGLGHRRACPLLSRNLQSNRQSEHISKQKIVV